MYPTGNSAVEKQQGYEVKGMEQTKKGMEKKPLPGESTDIVINILDEEESRQELASENEGWIATKNYTNRNSHVERQKDVVAGKSSGLMETERAHQGLEREPFEGELIRCDLKVVAIQTELFEFITGDVKLGNATVAFGPCVCACAKKKGLSKRTTE